MLENVSHTACFIVCWLTWVDDKPYRQPIATNLCDTKRDKWPSLAQNNVKGMSWHAKDFVVYRPTNPFYFLFLLGLVYVHTPSGFRPGFNGRHMVSHLDKQARCLLSIALLAGWRLPIWRRCGFVNNASRCRLTAPKIRLRAGQIGDRSEVVTRWPVTCNLAAAGRLLASVTSINCVLQLFAASSATVTRKKYHEE